MRTHARLCRSVYAVGGRTKGQLVTTPSAASTLALLNYRRCSTSLVTTEPSVTAATPDTNCSNGQDGELGEMVGAYVTEPPPPLKIEIPSARN